MISHMVQHPAKYSDVLLPILDQFLGSSNRILDPFAGTGKLRLIRPDAYLVEIEYIWAKAANAICGNALMLPFSNGSFDAICTSPTYANRMADHHNARDKSRRNTYRHTLGQQLHPENSGSLQWGESYRVFHQKAWKECWRVLIPGGMLVLNISDHIRGGEVIKVSDWHTEVLQQIGFDLTYSVLVPTHRNRYGKNHELRVLSEQVLLFRRPS
jgi:SAM-dependent methyltransferase